MGNKSFLLILFIVALTFSCTKDSLTKDLKGKWVRVDDNTQVMTFGHYYNDNWFSLLKGYRIDNEGNQRPIELLGEYAINDNSDSISIHWMHSSLSVWPDYYFAFKGSKIEIGDFIDGSDAIIVFEKAE
jgi:hypothetical protein